MKYELINNNIYLSDIDSFKVSEILECGQCFRFEKLGEEDYVIVAYGKILRIKEEDGQIIFFYSNISDFENIWINYFDINTDYKHIKTEIGKDDSVMQNSIEFAQGIRILNQEFFECLISFIISQNNRIPMIKKVIANISQKFGDYLGNVEGIDYYSFPTVDQLSVATEEELMSCKTGFRAKYIMDAVQKVQMGEIDFNKFSKMDTSTLRNELIKIKGVGPKVADCVLLFSCGRGEVFPTDVWVKRIMAHFYFDGIETPIKEIHEKADTNFGKYAGFAQQYLFNYARTQKIGTDKK